MGQHNYVTYAANDHRRIQLSAMKLSIVYVTDRDASVRSRTVGEHQ